MIKSWWKSKTQKQIDELRRIGREGMAAALQKDIPYVFVAPVEALVDYEELIITIAETLDKETRVVWKVPSVIQGEWFDNPQEFKTTMLARIAVLKNNKQKKDGDNKEMSNKNYIVINGKKAELTEEQLKQLGIEVEPAVGPYQSGNISIGSRGCPVECTSSLDLNACRMNYNTFADFDFAQQVAWHQKLDRELWNFSFINGWNREEWKKRAKWIIYYDEQCSNFTIGTYWFSNCNAPCFVSEKVAERAIEEVVKPFMQDHPKFYWGM